MESKRVPAPEEHFVVEPTEGGCRITRYTGPGGSVVIPGEIGGAKVVMVGRPRTSFSDDHSPFINCTTLTSVVIPESVTCIQDSAFRGCSSLTDVVIPEGVTFIGQGAFGSCPAITLRVKDGSNAHRCASERRIPFELI